MIQKYYLSAFQNVLNVHLVNWSSFLLPGSIFRAFLHWPGIGWGIGWIHPNTRKVLGGREKCECSSYLEPKFTLIISFHYTKFHQNRATGLDFLLHKPDASYAIFLIFKCQYRGVLFILMKILLKTEIYIEHKLSPQKVSSKSGHRFRIFTSYGRCFMTIFQVPISGWSRLSIKIFT